MNELKSYTEYAVSTPTADFVIGFDFNYGEDAVNVTVDDVPANAAGYTVVYLNETTIRLSPSVPSGVVRLQRETDIDQADHAYRAGAKFIAQTMDENFEQLRHSQQEVRDGFNKLADDTYEIIDTLQEVGQSAQDAADAAEVAAVLANDAAAQVNDKVSYEDFNSKPHNAMLDRDASSAHPTSSILDASGATQQDINDFGGAKRRNKSGGYALHARVVLENGGIVKSTIDGNTNDPNVDMTGWIKTNSASQIFDEGGLSQQEVNDLFKVKLDDYLLIEDFGGDTTGVNSSDAAIASGLAASSSSGLPLIINGKVRITKTVNQPLNSIVYCTGVVFCTDPSGLTGGWMWDVNHGGSVANKTEITRLILAASDIAGIETNRNMKGLRVQSPSVKVGTVKTYGCLDGGVEFGPTGYEIFADVVSCNIGAYSTNVSALGFKISTTDCGAQNVTTMGYPNGANLGSTNFVDNIHVWGYPATTNASEYANKQMLTGVILGSSTRANYVYVDTPDTALYDTPVAENAGVALVFNGWGSSVGSFYVRVHPQTKANKIKLIKYKGFSNSIDYMHPSTRFDTTNPVIYDTPDLQWRNNITYSTVATNITNFTFNVGTMLPSGVTQAAGTMSIRKQGKLAVIYFYYTIQAVDTSVAGDFKIPLPTGLSVASGASSVLTTRSCLTQHPSAVGGMDFATINGSSQILIRQRNAESGNVFIFQNSQLRLGAIELGITVSM